MESPERCAICLESSLKVSSCINRHEFCRDCIFTWLKEGPHGEDNDQDPKCPICRAELPDPDDPTHGAPRAQALYVIRPAGPDSFFFWETDEQGTVNWVVTIGLESANGMLGEGKKSPAKPDIAYPNWPQYYDPKKKPAATRKLLLNMRAPEGNSAGSLAPGPGPQGEHPLYVIGKDWEVRDHPTENVIASPQPLPDLPELDAELMYKVLNSEQETKGLVRTSRRELAVAAMEVAVHVMWGDGNVTGMKEFPHLPDQVVYVVTREVPPDPDFSSWPSSASEGGETTSDLGESDGEAETDEDDEEIGFHQMVSDMDEEELGLHETSEDESEDESEAAVEEMVEDEHQVSWNQWVEDILDDMDG